MWVFHVTSCKEVAFDVVNGEEFASEAWAKLVPHYPASERPEGAPQGHHRPALLIFLLRVDRKVKGLERFDTMDVDIAILNGLTSQYNARDPNAIKLIGLSGVRLDRARRHQTQDDRVEFETSAAGCKAMIAERGNSRNSQPSHSHASLLAHVQLMPPRIAKAVRSSNAIKRTDGQRRANVTTAVVGTVASVTTVAPGTKRSTEASRAGEITVAKKRRAPRVLLLRGTSKRYLECRNR